MKHYFTFRNAAEIGVGLIAIISLVLAGCSGGGSSSSTNAGIQPSVVVVPYKGIYISGTVSLIDNTGATVGSGVIATNGVATVSYSATAVFPISAQVIGTYINEATRTTETSTTPIRTLIPDATTAAAASGVAVTAVTEVAVAQVAAANGGKLTGVSAASAVASFTTAETLLGLPSGAATSIPVFNTSGQTSDANTLRLAALAVSAQSNGTGADLAAKLVNMANSLASASSAAPSSDPILANLSAALTNVETGASSVLPSGTTAPVGLTFVVPSSSVASLETIAQANASASPIVGKWTIGSNVSFTFDSSGNYTQSQTTVSGNSTYTVQQMQVWPGIEKGTYTYNSTTGALVFTCPTIDTNGSAGLSNVAPGGYTGYGGVPIGSVCSWTTRSFTAAITQNSLTLTNDSLASTNPAINMTRAAGLNTNAAVTAFAVIDPVTSRPVKPFGIAAGPDGNLWFTAYPDNSTATGAQIGKLTTAGVVTLYDIPGLYSQPQTIIAGPDGNMWFVEGGNGVYPNGNKIAKITTAGVITEYANTRGGWPQDLTVGGDGNIWFTDQGVLGGGESSYNLNGSIGKITTDGVITKYPLPSANTEANWITTGSDGNVWFTIANSSGASKVARITTSGVITVFSSGGAMITSGPDGNLWVTTLTGAYKMDASGNPLANYTLPASSAGVSTWIKSGPDGNLWFSELGGVSATGWLSATTTGNGGLGSVTTSGSFTDYAVPAPANTFPSNMAVGPLTVGPDGAIWFTMPRSGKIGRYGN